MARILLVRHGNTTAPEGVFAGTTDNPLSDRGRGQAALLAERLAAEKVDAVYCSDKSRAMETADIICKPHRLVAIASSDLREICHGRWEGRTKDEVVKEWPDEYAEWESDPYLFAPEGGEPAIEVVQRVIPFVRGIVRSSMGKTVVIVSHKATLRLVIAHYMGIPHRLYRDLFELDQASLSTLVFKRDNQAKLLLFNDTSHYVPPS
jgi:probable phosphoglycerate mutase